MENKLATYLHSNSETLACELAKVYMEATFKDGSAGDFCSDFIKNVDTIFNELQKLDYEPEI